MAQVATQTPGWLAREAARELQRLLTPHCERIQIAGSVRRREQVCGDLDIVVIPRVETDIPQGCLYAEPVDRLEAFTAAVAAGSVPELVRPVAPDDQRAPPWGPRLKKLLLQFKGRWMPVELHIADRERWGSVLAIRTGNAEFSHLLVTSRSEGGAMPFRMRQADGGLQRLLEWQEYGPDPEQYAEPRWEAVATPEEADYFTALGLPWIEPFRRNRSVLRRWLLQPSSSPPTTGMCHAGPDQEGK